MNYYLKNAGFFELLNDFVNCDVFGNINVVDEELHLEVFLKVEVRIRNILENQFFADMWGAFFVVFLY